MPWQTNYPLTTTKISASPVYFTDNWAAIEDWSVVDHYGLTEVLSGRHKPGAALWYVNTTTAITALSSPVACAAAFDITLNSLKYYNGAAWVDLGGVVPSGTKMLFYQDIAPTGWVIESALDDKVVYLTKGSGDGGEIGGGVHSTGTWVIPTHYHIDDGYALEVEEMPSHTHSSTVKQARSGVNLDFAPPAPETANGDKTAIAKFATVGGSSTPASSWTVPHTHGDAGISSFIPWRPATYCCIIATKT